MNKFTKVFKVLFLICLFVLFFQIKANANTEEPDYRYWNQTNYNDLYNQCYVVAEAKLLYAANIQRDPSFNPLSWWWWKNGYNVYCGGPASLMEQYASSIGKELVYKGTCDGSNVWDKINAGYFVILHLTNGQSGDVGHYAFVDNEYSKKYGEIWIDESGAGYSNLPYGGNGPRALSSCERNIILSDGVSFYSGSLKPDIPSNLLNLGDNFYSYILMSNDVTLFNVDDGTKVVLQNGVHQDTKQAWNFIKQPNGSYKIKNQSTNKYLAMPLSGDSNGGTITTIENKYDSNYCVDFYLYGSQANCVIKPVVCDTRTVSIDGGLNVVGAKLNMWDYWATQTQLFYIWKIDDVAMPTTLNYTVDEEHLTLNWTHTTYNYNIHIYRSKDVFSEISLYQTIDNFTGNSYEIDLPDNYRYYVSVDSVNWCNTATSNEVSFVIDEIQKASVKYKTHVQTIGWQDFVSDGQTSGTSGRSLRLEGIKIEVDSDKYSGDILYSTHVQSIGWQDFVKNGALSGTTGKKLRLEAIKIKLTGELAEHYDIYYRVHCQKIGWMGWAKNGESAGSAGFGYRLEGIQIKLVKKGNNAPGDTNNKFRRNISYQTFIQKDGMLDSVWWGETSGKPGQSLRLEGYKINLIGSNDIQYRSLVQGNGWMPWVGNNEYSGTKGKGLRLEAIQISLNGQTEKAYDIYYRVYCQKLGWMGWAKNGQSAGTNGYGYRIEGIQIKLVQKNEQFDGNTDNSFIEK